MYLKEGRVRDALETMLGRLDEIVGLPDRLTLWRQWYRASSPKPASTLYAPVAHKVHNGSGAGGVSVVVAKNSTSPGNYGYIRQPQQRTVAGTGGGTAAGNPQRCNRLHRATG